MQNLSSCFQIDDCIKELKQNNGEYFKIYFSTILHLMTMVSLWQITNIENLESERKDDNLWMNV